MVKYNCYIECLFWYTREDPHEEDAISCEPQDRNYVVLLAP